MLYKVTPAMTPPEPAAPPAAAAPKKEKKLRGPRKKRKSAVYDAEGNEVLISLTCLKCKNLKPLAQFGLRKMGDGAIRNQPWCRGCRAGAGTKGKKQQPSVETVQASPEAPVSATPVEAPVSPPVAVPVTPPAVEASPVQAAAPAASPRPQPEQPSSPWMAAIASLRAVVGRPAQSDRNDRSGSDES